MLRSVHLIHHMLICLLLRCANPCTTSRYFCFMMCEHRNKSKSRGNKCSPAAVCHPHVLWTYLDWYGCLRNTSTIMQDSADNSNLQQLANDYSAPASGGSSQWRRFFVRKPPATQVHAECFSACFVVSFTILQEAFVAQDSMIARVDHHAR